jgi:hypothetical protein
MSWLSQEINRVESTTVGKIVTAIAVAIAAPEVGAALGLTGVVAAAAGGAITSAGIAAAAGDTTKQIENAAATGAVGAAVGAAVGGGAPTDIVSGAEAGAASGAASGATQAALTGQNIGQAAVKGAETGGVVGGASSGLTNLTNQVAAGGQPISQPVYDYSGAIGSPPIETTIAPNYSLTPGGITQAGLPETVASPVVYGPGGEIIPGSSSTLVNPSSVPTSGATNYEDINIGANYNPTANVLTPGGVDYSLGSGLPGEGLTGTPQDALTTPVAGLSNEALGALKSAYGAGLGILLGGKAPGLGSISPSTTGTASTTGTTSSTTGGAPGGTELDPSTGKAPQLVWGDKYSSLKEGLNL